MYIFTIIPWEAVVRQVHVREARMKMLQLRRQRCERVDCVQDSVQYYYSIIYDITLHYYTNPIEVLQKSISQFKKASVKFAINLFTNSLLSFLTNSPPFFLHTSASAAAAALWGGCTPHQLQWDISWLIQHTAAHCNSLHRTATHCNTQPPVRWFVRETQLCLLLYYT